MDYGDEDDAKSEFYTSEIDWGAETDHSWSGEQDCDNSSWREETDSEISIEGVDERGEEPCYEETNSEGDFEEEERQVVDETELDSYAYEADYGESSWRDETCYASDFGGEPDDNDLEPEPPDCHRSYSNTTWYEESSEESSYDDYQPPKRAERFHGYGVVPYRAHAYSPPTSPKKQVKKRSSSLLFSGTSKDPEDYLQWEANMEKWLQSNHIPNEIKLAQIVSAFIGKAKDWWEKESTLTTYKKPVLDWKDLKSRMHKEFVEKLQPRPRRVKSASKPQAASNSDSKKAQTKKTSPTMENQHDPFIRSKIRPDLLDWWQQFKKEYNIKDAFESKREGVASQAATPGSNALSKSQGTPTQGESSNLANSKEPTCYRCHKRGHFAAKCPSRKELKETSLEEKELAKTSDSLFHSDSLIPNSRLMPLSLPKSFDPGIKQEERHTSKGEKLQEKQTNHVTCLKKTENEEDDQSEALSPHTSKERIIIQLIDVIDVSLSITRPISIVLNSDIMHLFLVQNAENISGYKDVKEVPPDKHLLLEESTPKKTSTKATKEVKDNTNQLRGINHAQYQNRGVILSYLLKGEPPDVPPITKYQPYQGKTRSSQKRMKANLLSLGAGDLVSRSKLLQEGEYDEDIKSSSAQEHGDMRLGDGSMKLRRAKETCEQSSAQMEANTNRFSSTITWRTHSTHLELTTKKNHPKRIPYEEDIPLTTRWISSEPEGDQHALNEAYRPNQEELSNESNCSRTPTNHKHAAKWNQPIISSHEGDIVFLKQRILHLLYLEAHGFWRLQTYHWRPGDFMILLQTSYNILGCTNMHRIKWIKLEPNFPFSDPFDINAERLFPLTLVRLQKIYSVHLDIPRHHQYSPKLSRLKHQRLFPYSADTPQSHPTAICIKFDSFVSFFRFLGRCTQLYIS